MPDIFKYTNFRKYLADYYAEKKAKSRYFSYRYFSDQIGFKSKDFIFRVINKEKTVSQSSVFKISSAIGHSPEESSYFGNLVNFNQATTPREKEFFFDQLRKAEKGESREQPLVRLGRTQLGLFSHWYYLAVRAIIEMTDFKDDCAWMAKQIYPAITPKKVREALRFLEKQKLVLKDGNGCYRVTSRALATDPDVANMDLVRFYIDCTRLGAHAIEELPRDKRNVSGLTLGISKKSYDEIVGRISRFREEIARIADCDNEADRVVQMQIVLFPMSEVVRKEKAES